MAPRNVDKMPSTITLVSIVLFATLCASHLSFVEANYYYHAGTNSYHHSKASGHYSSGMSPHHQIMHHKHHQHHGHNGRLQQAAVGVVNRGRLLPLTATTATTAPTTTLSPLDRLMSKLDSWDKQAPYDSGKRHHENLHHTNARRHDPVSPGLLRSSDRRYSQTRTKVEDSYEDNDNDDDEEEDDEDAVDEDEDEEDDEDEEESEYGRLTGERHQHPHRSHSSGHTSKEDPLFDSVAADFPHHAPGSPGSGTMSGGASGRGTSYSDYKWRVLNKDNMDILRNQRRGSTTYRAEASETQPYIKQVLDHNSEITKFGSCRIPKPKVIKVSDEYPNPSKTYFPHCTILHRCSDDTGCCSSDSSTCAALKMEQVERFFYTKILGGPRPVILVEKLIFQNHTVCTCLDTHQEMMPRDRPFSSTEHDNLGRSAFRGYYRPDMESAKTVSGSKGVSSCRCTSQFSPRHVADGSSCACECFDKQRECLRLKRGKDFLTHGDRICILRGDCMSPSCEFGTYLRKQGRCPRKSEKFDAWQTYPLHDEEYQ